MQHGFVAPLLHWSRCSKRSQPSMALLMIREYLPTMGRPADVIAMVWHR